MTLARRSPSRSLPLPLALPLLLLLAVLTTLSTTPAHAAPSGPGGHGHRSIAVLEFRQDVSALPGLADRMARRIRKLTGHRVLGPTEARQKLGAVVDNHVAQCQGQPTCVGALGTRLGVSEVILIGMSSLGDVIIQISRVRAATRKPLSSVAHTASADAALSQKTLDAWIKRLLPPKDFLRYGYIRVNANKNDATVFLDKERHGTTPLPNPLKVRAPSTHELRVKKDGYVPFSARVQVPPEATIQVDANLVPVSKAGPPYYKRWWFWTAVAGGVALVAGVTAGLTVGLREKDNTVPAVIRW